jgi:hypothetical protein
VDAFDVYDTKNPASGFCFTLEHSICTVGMVGVDKSAELVQKWLQVDEVERANLYLRAFMFNQTYLQDEANKSLKEIKKLIGPVKDVSLVDSKLWLKSGKGLVDGFKKIDSAWDEWLRDKAIRKVHLEGLRIEHSTDIRSLSKFHHSATGIFFKFVSEITQSASRLAIGGKLDKFIVGYASFFLQSRLGDLAESLAHDLLMLRIDPAKLAEGYKRRSAARNAEIQQRHVDRRASRMAAKGDDAIEVLVKDAQAKAREKVKLTREQLDKGARPGTNNYHQARIGAVLFGIECLALTNKLEHFEDTPRARADITASVMSLASILVDMLYSVAKSIREIEPFKSLAVIERSADIIRGGLKITSGALSTSAGLIGACLDFSSLSNELSKDRPDHVLSAIYFTRGATSLYGAYLGLSAAFSYCGPLLIRIGETSARFSFQVIRFTAYGAAAAESLMASRTLLLLRLARWNTVGLVITGAEIGYRLFFKDNELEDWCDACTFRADKSTGWFSPTPFDTTKKEIEELYRSAKAIGINV